MQEYLYDSFYFTLSRLNRNITRIADESFKPIGIPPSYGYLLLLINEWKELSPTKISETLDIKPSTTTRFLDKLQKLGYITRRTEGKYSYISLSSLGMSKLPEIQGIIETLEFKITKMITAKVSERQKVVFTEIADRVSEKVKEAK